MIARLPEFHPLPPRNRETARVWIPLFRAYFASQRVQSAGIHSTTPTTLSRSENATTRERNAISTACRNNTRDWCNRAIGQHHPETKNSSGYSEHETRCWVENFGYYGWGELREVYRPPLAKCNTPIYSATPQPTPKFCYTSGCGIHTLQPHGVAFSAQRWVYFRRGEQ